MINLRTELVRHGLTKFLSVRSSYHPTFSSDDRTLVYLSDTTGVPQVWSVGLSGGSPQQLTYYEDRVGSVSSARKSRTIVFEKDHGGDERFQLFLMTRGGYELRQLTDSPDVIHQFGEWSPSEDSFLFSSNTRNRAFFDVYTRSLPAGKVRCVHQSDHTNYGIDWSPDGRSILVLRMHAPYNHDLFLVRTRDLEARCLTEHKEDAIFDGAQFGADGRHIYVLTDVGRECTALATLEPDDPRPHFVFESKWDAEWLAVSDDGKRLAFATNEDGASKLTILEPPGPPTTVRMPVGVVSGTMWSHRGDMLAFAFSGANFNQDIWIHDLRDGSTKRMTRSSASGLDLQGLPSPELSRYASFDGLEVPYYFYRAEGPRGPSPAVVYIHGGPESEFRPGFNPFVQFLISVGLSVAAPNVRGSSGYGRTYTHLDDVRLRMNSVTDIERLVVHLKKAGDIDAKRIAVVGGSYGGFMVLACMYRYPKLWAAGVDIVGISNFVTFLKNTGAWRRKLRAVEYGDPEKDRTFLERISPLNNASKITAPLFMIHGINDPRVPIKESKQIARELRGLGRRAEMMVFEDEGHGLVKLKNRIKGYTAATEFLLTHLVGVPLRVGNPAKQEEHRVAHALRAP
jgi:dipeptidyl aminopeptidase/acylaminoacyl peptidase